jgi:hypothetical protein
MITLEALLTNLQCFRNLESWKLEMSLLQANACELCSGVLSNNAGIAADFDLIGSLSDCTINYHNFLCSSGDCGGELSGLLVYKLPVI